MLDLMIKKNGHWRILSLCPGCKKPGYRPKRSCSPSPTETILSLTKCRSCRMLGTHYRGPGKTLAVGWEFYRKNKGTYVRLPNGKFKAKHRIIMEGILGRPLKRGELVRFRDSDNTNLDPSNLFVEVRIMRSTGYAGITSSPKNDPS